MLSVFLLAIVEFVISFVLVTKKGTGKTGSEEVTNIKILFWSLGMLIGIPVIYFRNFFHLPNVKNYKPQNAYGLPFQGKWLTVNGGIEKENSHSWGICGQRYAYDFYIEENGTSYCAEGTSVNDYFCYGKEVLAPADGTVVELKNLFEDTPIRGRAKVDCTASDIRGNYVIIRHSEKEYSLIAHIKKDSFSVKAGDRVLRGQAIARCGNSGNTSEPHIHFQIQQGRSFLFSAGIPIYFDKIVNLTRPEAIHYISRGDSIEKRD